MDNIAGVILTGGRSRRMGTDKSQLKIGDKTLLEHAEQLLLNSGIKPIFISGAKSSSKDCIKDKYIDKGPLAGISASLNYLTRYDFILFIPVDMPLLTKQIIVELQTHMSSLLVHFSNYNLPLMIKNNAAIRKLIETQISSNQLSIYQLLQLLPTKSLNHGYSKYLFTNTNSPHQYQKLILNCSKE